MTFNVFASGDPVLASTTMQNYRHVNYGSVLLPVTNTGAGVDNTIDIGSVSYRFKDVYVNNFEGAAGSEICFNNDGLDIDFRWEASGFANAMFLQGSSGYIGIGTNNPGINLEIVGVGLRVGRSNDDSLVGFRNTANNHEWRIGMDYSNSESLNIAYGTSAPSLASSLFTILTSGKVGIGTSSPLGKYTLASDSGQTVYMDLWCLNSGGEDPILRFGGVASVTTPATTHMKWGIGWDRSNNKLNFLYDGTNGVTTADSDQLMTIDSSGLVGIGTSSPDRLLSLSSTAPAIAFVETGVAANNTKWDITVNAEQFTMRLVNDAYSAAQNFFVVDRTANTVDSVFFPQGSIGIGGVSTPAGQVEILAASGAQLVLSQSEGVDYVTHAVDASGDYTIAPSGNNTTITGNTSISRGDTTNAIFSLDNTSNSYHATIQFNTKTTAGANRNWFINADPDLDVLQYNSTTGHLFTSTGTFNLYLADTNTYINNGTNINFLTDKAKWVFQDVAVQSHAGFLIGATGSADSTLDDASSGTGSTTCYIGNQIIGTSTGTTGGSGSAGAGNQYIELKIGSSTYKLLHDGTV